MTVSACLYVGELLNIESSLLVPFPLLTKSFGVGQVTAIT